MTTHYDHDGQAACVARIKVPWLTGDAGTADCGNCRRTGAYSGPDYVTAAGRLSVRGRPTRPTSS